MSHSVVRGFNAIGFLTLAGLSSAAMVWLFWRFPLATGLVALALLASFEVSARVARWPDADQSA